MKISQLIQKLKTEIIKYGDIDVWVEIPHSRYDSTVLKNLSVDILSFVDGDICVIKTNQYSFYPGSSNDEK